MHPNKEIRAVPSRRNHSIVSLFIRFITGAALLFVLATLAFAWYAAPEEQLDWTSGPQPSLQDKVQEMLLARSLTFRLTEAEIDALLKQRWKDQAIVHPYVEVTGARFELEGSRLTAHTTLRVADAADVALVHEFHLDWEAPELIVTPISSAIKDIKLPKDWIRFEQIRIPLKLDPRLPVAVKNVAFIDSAVEIQMRLRAPSLFN